MARSGSGPEFSAGIVDVVAKRAALLCSNPDCRKLTVGPNSDQGKFTNIGEAAHIFGARPSSGRYRPEMTDIERATITNAIWLCRDCHGLIDRDAVKFPGDMLLLWRQHHEERNLRELGRPSDLVLLQLAERQRTEFEGVPIFCLHLIQERPKFWEFFFAAELLDDRLKPSLAHAQHLSRGLIANSHRRLTEADCVPWAQTLMAEVTDLTATTSKVLEEFLEAFGPSGQPGDAHKIVEAAYLYVRCTKRMLELAEDAAFARGPKGYEELVSCVSELTAYAVGQLGELSTFFRSIPSETTSIESSFFLTIELVPQGWEKRFYRTLKSIRRLQRGGWW